MHKSKLFKRYHLLYNTGLYVINFKINILVINCDMYFFYKKYKNFIKLFIQRLKKMRISSLFLNFVQYRLKILSYSKFLKRRSELKINNNYNKNINYYNNKNKNNNNNYTKNINYYNKNENLKKKKKNKNKKWKIT